MITRRLFAGMLPGAAASAPGILKSVAQSMAKASTPAVGYYKETGEAGASIQKISPKMTHEEALDAVKRLPWIRDKLKEYYSEAAKVTTIDYDILIKKSWSDMYKVTVQKERNVNRLVDSAMEGNSFKATSNPFHETLHKMMWG